MSFFQLPLRTRLIAICGIFLAFSILLAIHFLVDERRTSGNPIPIDVVRSFFGTTIHFFSVERTADGQVILHGRISNFSRVPKRPHQCAGSVSGGPDLKSPASSGLFLAQILPDTAHSDSRLIDIPLWDPPLSSESIYWNLGFTLEYTNMGSLTGCDAYMGFVTPNPGRSLIKRNFEESSKVQLIGGVSFKLSEFSETKSTNMPHRSWSDYFDGAGEDVVWDSAIKVSASDPSWLQVGLVATPNIASGPPMFVRGTRTFRLEDGPYQIKALMIHYKVFPVPEVEAFKTPSTPEGSTAINRSIVWNGTRVDLENIEWSENSATALHMCFRAAVLFSGSQSPGSKYLPRETPIKQETSDDPFPLRPFCLNPECMMDVFEPGKFGGGSLCPVSEVMRSTPASVDTKAKVFIDVGGKFDLYVVDKTEIVTFIAQPEIK